MLVRDGTAVDGVVVVVVATLSLPQGCNLKRNQRMDGWMDESPNKGDVAVADGLAIQLPLAMQHRPGKCTCLVTPNKSVHLFYNIYMGFDAYVSSLALHMLPCRHHTPLQQQHQHEIPQMMVIMHHILQKLDVIFIISGILNYHD